jgi:hypothetical protein
VNLQRYNYFKSNDHRAYEFYSEGPKGRITKLVLFTKVPDTEPAIYNLAFGDKDPLTGELDDKVKSNNNDRDIVLATVANAVIESCRHYNNPYIYAEGSTAVRTRLYQMAITRLWSEIGVDFDLFGLYNDRWYRFNPKSVNYEAFLLKRK